jgi:hypothetical protein
MREGERARMWTSLPTGEQKTLIVFTHQNTMTLVKPYYKVHIFYISSYGLSATQSTGMLMDLTEIEKMER